MSYNIKSYNTCFDFWLASGWPAGLFPAGWPVAGRVPDCPIVGAKNPPCGNRQPPLVGADKPPIGIDKPGTLVGFDKPGILFFANPLYWNWQTCSILDMTNPLLLGLTNPSCGVSQTPLLLHTNPSLSGYYFSFMAHKSHCGT